MDSSVRVFRKQRRLHEILGGGFVADVILWRRRHVTIGILLGTLAAWMIFEVSGYTLLSLMSYVLLLLISILFVWAKAAETLNRPAPPIPDMHLSEEFIKKAAVLVHSCLNMALTVFHKISLGKDSKLFYRVAVCLWLISAVGGLTDFLTLGYTSLVIVLTIPVLYDQYEDSIDRYVNLAILDMLMYERIYEEYFNNVRKWIVEKTKLIVVDGAYE